MGFTMDTRITLAVIFVFCLGGSLTGCAGRMARQDQDPQEPTKAQAVEPTSPAENPRNTMIGMSARLDALESKMSAMNDKLDATRVSLDNFLAAHQPKATGTPMVAADTVGTSVATAPVSNDSEAGFVNDDAVQQYRKAEVLLDTQKYADALLAFSSFLEKYPDHPLAGSAQFHVGEAYFKQKDYRQAEQEFQKVLTSYDRSIHVSDTLRLMAAAETALGKSEEAARHRQQLTSLFANSPAATQPAPALAPAQATVPPASVKSASGRPGLDEVPPTTPVTAPLNEAAPATEKTEHE